jgi:predicted nucleic acid-binding protein
MVLFDTSVLVLAFDNKASVPTDPVTGLPVEKCQQRIKHLVASISKLKQRVLIPTPTLAEYLVYAGDDKHRRLDEFMTSKAFSVAPFDIRAAVECALLEDGNSRRGKPVSPVETKVKVKFDRQIIAIAKARGTRVIYTGDKGLAGCARQNNVEVVMTWEIPLPPVEPQMELPYPDKGEHE